MDTSIYIPQGLLIQKKQVQSYSFYASVKAIFLLFSHKSLIQIIREIILTN